ncbi:MalM family protein [Photobacterium sp. TY1-4]|uniref:MalM family protein n=1 Tax=Photobacterium sp. TY1-4 TaxID=2899122 RepID=UPI0021C20542|nr:MalM family protein [Photobacterium sp. TY1-4]UXI04300.1 MalM family protein [Photobacterium sp. TY1-4]
MKMIKTTLAAVLVASLLGCAASPTAQENKTVTIAQAPCCESFREFAWVPMQGDEIDFVVDAYSQVGQFEDGKSYFSAFALPANVERMQVTLNSWMKSEGVFAPKVLLLDPNFKPVKTIALDEFTVAPSKMFSLSSYQHRFTMDQATTPYLVVYSPLEYRKEAITIPHPERLRAEELGLARPMVTDPVIEHQRFGSLTLDLKALNMRAYRVGETQPLPQPAAVPATAPISTAVPAPIPTAAPTVKPVAAPVTSGPAMLAESEAFYNTQIKAAVAKNDIQKALRLMEEAKRAGSTTAEATFIELMRK